MIWVGFCIVVIVAIMATFVFSKSGKASDPLAYYKAQLKELELDIKRGLIDQASVKSARLEIERRILKAGAATTVQSTQITKHSLPLQKEIISALIIIAGSFTLYHVFGSPNIASSPAARTDLEKRQISEGGPTFKEAIVQIQNHLENNPDDAKGWEVLTTSTRAIGDYATTIHAYDQLIRLQPNNTDWYIRQLEAYISMANGRITPAANLALNNILNIAPGHPAGQFYLGLAQKQSGNLEGAYQTWKALLDNSQPTAPWYVAVSEQLAEISPSLPKSITNGPTAEDIEAVANLTAEDQAIFINSMIDRLRNRLSDAPNDIEGWKMLARALVQQDRKAEAIDALEGAIERVSENNKANIRELLDNLVRNNDL
jgi:cytochrome c-type biogenesis protein CcmH